MGERKLPPDRSQARAIRDFPEKLALYIEALHFAPFVSDNWYWNQDGSGVGSTPSMMKIEQWFTENVMCEICQGRKYTTKPLNDFTQHGSSKCHACRGTGRRQEDED